MRTRETAYGRDFGKPKLDRADVRKILGISRTTMYRLEKEGKLIPQFTIGRFARYDYDYIQNFRLKK